MKKIIISFNTVFFVIAISKAFDVGTDNSKCKVSKKDESFFTECDKIFLSPGQRKKSPRRKRLLDVGSPGMDKLSKLEDTLNLKLKQTSVRTTPDFLFLNSKLNETDILSAIEPTNCIFQGKSHNQSAVINICNGMSGYLSNGTNNFLLKSDEFQSHVELFTIKPDSDISHFSKPILSSVPNKPKFRRKIEEVEAERRSDDGEVAGKSHFIEMAVFVDRHLKEKLQELFHTDLEETISGLVMAMIGSVNVLFSHPSLGIRLEILLKRIEVLSDVPDSFDDDSNIRSCLANFCKWQNEKALKLDRQLRWDHALLLTGLDLHTTSQDGKISQKVVGLAPISGMCDSTSSCSVIEGNSFESVFSIAHELGHNLGMSHDGLEGSNSCDPGGFIMSPTLNGNKNTWSSCSRESLNNFLRSESAECLTNLKPGLVQRKSDSLPGENFSADVQCQLRYGPSSQHSIHQDLADICRDLHCVKDHFTWTSHPAIEGTSCGISHWCRRGNCTKKKGTENAQKSSISAKKIPEENSLQWSEWSPFSDCRPSCVTRPNNTLSSGIRFSSRQCSNDDESGDKDVCMGESLRFQTCTSEKACSQVSPLRDFVSSVCLSTSNGQRRAAKIVPDSCEVYCQDDGRNFRFASHLPDGIECGATKDQKFCVRGKCQEFSCSKSSRFQLNSDDCVTISEGTWSSWQPSSTCLSSCLLPSHGIRFVQRYCLGEGCSGPQRSVQTCSDRHHETKCSQHVTTTKYASEYCLKFQSPHLSGFGGQLKPTQEDPDRPCKIACQDWKLNNRFYISGIFPTTTRCGDNGICVRGLCLDLDLDGTLKHHSTLIKKEFGNFWSLEKKRRKRESVFENPKRIPGSIDESLLVKILRELNETSLNFEGNEDFSNFMSIPIDVDYNIFDVASSASIGSEFCYKSLAIIFLNKYLL